MIKATWDFLAMAEKACVEMNFNQETGEYEKVEPCKKAE